MTTDILSKNEQKSEAESYDYGRFAFLGKDGPRRETAPVLYVPEGFRPKKHLRRELRRYADPAQYFLHLIHVRSIFDKRMKNGWVTLKAGFLGPDLPWRRYRAILEDLEAAGAIEVKRDREGRPEWRKGRRSKLYRFSEAGWTATVRRYEPQNRTLQRKLIQWRDDEPDRTSSCPVRCYLREQLKRVRVDYQAAVDLS